MPQSENSVPRLKGYLPEHPVRTYEPVGHCIYCGSTAVLSDEHIIPLGLGGRFVLPRASCPSCSIETSKFERTCLRTMYGPLRLLYDLPSRRKKGRPEKLRLKVKYTPTQDWEFIAIPQERFPFLITFPYLGMPRIFTGSPISAAPGPVTQRLWIRGASPSYNFHELLQSLSVELKVHSIMPESSADVPSFCRMLAKIALAFAVAERGINSPTNGISAYARGDDLPNCLHYIGSKEQDEPPDERLHNLSFIDIGSTDFLTVRIRLLSKLGTPTYYVVVGA